MTRFDQFSRLFLVILLLVSVFCDTGSAYTCSLDDFRQSRLYDDNFDLTTLSQSYEGGATVRVRCNVGFRGFFKMICSSNGWTSSSEKCRPVSCGHPGDVPNADFELTEGTDYVFGSQVQFTCHRGYQMISSTGLRNCLQGGWDNHLPECEPVTCSSLRVDYKVLVIGDIDEAEVDSVVQFSCSSSDEMLVGPTQIICGDNGKWNNETPPTCQPIVCPKPPLVNFVVEGAKNEYGKDEVLRYTCDEKYRKTDWRHSLCLKVGQSAQWVPAPRCELITCKVDQKKGTEYNPRNQIIFKPGEKVTVTCGEKMWVKNVLNQSAELTCQDNGEWDFPHVCKEVTCRKPTDRISTWGQYPYRKDTYLMDAKASYQCHRDYEETSPRAKCTRRSWEPNPLCIERRCDQPGYDNAETADDRTSGKYNHNDRVNFTCTYSPSDAFSVVCRFGRWEGYVPTCREEPCRKDPEITNGVIQNEQKTEYEHNDELQISCYDRSTFSVTCRSGKWDIPKSCKDVSCERPKFNNGEMIDSTLERFDNNQTAEIRCRSGPVERITVRCDLGKWIPEPHCPEISVSGSPHINNGVWVNQEERMYYKCEDGYQLQINRHQGVDGEWNTLECAEKGCSKPFYNNSEIADNPISDTYNHSNRVNFTCTYNTSDTFSVVCRFGEWKDYVPTCREEPCRQDPEITNGVIQSHKKTEYEHNDELQISCDDQSSFSVTCRSGEWDIPKSCKDADAAEKDN